MEPHSRISRELRRGESDLLPLGVNPPLRPACGGPASPRGLGSDFLELDLPSPSPAPLERGSPRLVPGDHASLTVSLTET
ncbi:hypothetical protein SKAU_G00379930 [Synaphobranchus kaupii]|uniref:Uncharacterized protein n=1 Tax=Synaphobranchus kaupii TaxID=118154 RepID=A0A9Q1EDG2_SYNKA|nr:hypothetical protein SKAU_G00379930 [Synaphobranchus kaupii]